ncbi:MAG: ABC transporter ATP-binding protein [Calditrichia bacterium]|nr:ABC transporter ATP-binding protein [Calditrichota bacterium]MCB0268847.1 ABC transporter ATP-binding protein [Calditrichota bacterium]MCB0286047.1 ABC transporter ATP-binding protein [Calditrichota bacterium]
MRITADNISKYFQRRQVLKNIHFQIDSPGALVVTGPNGSGKSTLVRIICGLMGASSGTVNFIENGKTLDQIDAAQQIGLVSPYLQLYKDLTAWENLSFFAKSRTGHVEKKRILELLTAVGLNNRLHDPLRAYSSGMLQRVKYAAALYHQPKILILDEPTANLDETGKQWVYSIIETYRQSNIVIIATNEPEEVVLATQRVDVT